MTIIPVITTHSDRGGVNSRKASGRAAKSRDKAYHKSCNVASSTNVRSVSRQMQIIQGLS